jgi:uncharacterized protein YqeY
MLKARILDDIKTAMKAGDKPRLGVLRLISAAIKQREVDERIELDDTQVLAVLEKMLKQRRESIAQYQAAKRDDLVAQEEFEVAILQEYLPQPLTAAEIEEAVTKAIADTGAASIKDMGKVVGLLKGPMLGRADMAQVSALVKQKLSAS